MGQGALVVGGDYRGLGVVRSLGRRGIPVWVLTDGDDVLATRSRYAARHMPLLGTSNEEQAESLLRLADEHALDGWALFPTSDRTAAMIGQHHAELGQSLRADDSIVGHAALGIRQAPDVRAGRADRRPLPAHLEGSGREPRRRGFPSSSRSS